MNAVTAHNFKTLQFSINCNWRAGKSNKTCLYFSKFNNFIFPGKLNWKFHLSLNHADFQQGSNLFKSNLLCQLILRLMNWLTKVSNSVFSKNQKFLKICHKKQKKLSVVFQLCQLTSRAFAHRRKTQLCLN